VLRKIDDVDDSGLSFLGNHCESFETTDNRTGEENCKQSLKKKEGKKETKERKKQRKDRRRLERVSMCSIIAANRQKEMELIFLENRDRPKELFIGNDVRKIGDVVGVYDFRAQGIACGYSLKAGVAGGVANILGYYGKKSRGVLLLNALQSGCSAKDVREIIEQEVSSGEFSSATYVICDKDSIFRIESFGKEVTSLAQGSAKKFVVTTNHFHRLKNGKKSKDSILREKYLKLLGNGRITKEKVLKLATRHRNPAICRHGKTLASFAVFKRKEEQGAQILYSIGEPCKGYSEFKMS
jgi:hypothetical protein